MILTLNVLTEINNSNVRLRDTPEYVKQQYIWGYSYYYQQHPGSCAAVQKLLALTGYMLLVGKGRKDTEDIQCFSITIIFKDFILHLKFQKEVPYKSYMKICIFLSPGN